MEWCRNGAYFEYFFETLELLEKLHKKFQPKVQPEEKVACYVAASQKESGIL